MTGPDSGGEMGTPGDALAVCPHCWHVNPGLFRLCGRCGAQMDTVLQESGGLRRTAPIQSPVPVSGARVGPVARVVLGAFVLVLALGYLVHLLPLPRDVRLLPQPATAPH